MVSFLILITQEKTFSKKAIYMHFLFDITIFEMTTYIPQNNFLYLLYVNLSTYITVLYPSRFTL